METCSSYYSVNNLFNPSSICILETNVLHLKTFYAAKCFFLVTTEAVSNPLVMQPAQ